MSSAIISAGKFKGAEFYITTPPFTSLRCYLLESAEQRQYHSPHLLARDERTELAFFFLDWQPLSAIQKTTVHSTTMFAGKRYILFLRRVSFTVCFVLPVYNRNESEF